MADTESQKQPPGFIINAQYVKDMSFENPNAPASLFGSKEKPAIELAVDLKAGRMKDETYEVTMILSAKAAMDKDVVFVAELSYAGIFTLINVPENKTEPLLLIEGPQMLFPFARRVIADMTREGGFPPLMLEPMDFASLYASRKAMEEKQETAEA